MNTVKFGRDQKVGRLAKRKGAFLCVDGTAPGRYALQLSADEIEKRRAAAVQRGGVSIDPYMIMIQATLDEIEDYLKTHVGPHKTLGPATVIGAIRQDD